MIECKPSYNGVAIKRCSWPPGTCVTHFSSNTENIPVNMLSTRSGFDNEVSRQKRSAMNNFFRTSSRPVTVLIVE